jgi:hypothetical protein
VGRSGSIALAVTLTLTLAFGGGALGAQRSAARGRRIAAAGGEHDPCYTRPGNWSGVTDQKLPGPADTTVGEPGDEVTTTWAPLSGGGDMTVQIARDGSVTMSVDETFTTLETVDSEFLIGQTVASGSNEYDVEFTRDAEELTGTLVDLPQGSSGRLTMTVSGRITLTEQGASTGPRTQDDPYRSTLTGSYDCEAGSLILKNKTFGKVALTGKAEPDQPGCEYEHLLGVPVPNSRCTPGQSVGESVQTICAHNYSEGARRVSQSLKDRIYAAYGLMRQPRGTYQIDHLVPISVGGANTPSNLWPEPAPSYHAKDALEHGAWRVLCKSSLSDTEKTQDMRDFQAAFADGWPLVGLILTNVSKASSHAADRASVARVRKHKHKRKPRLVKLYGLGATEAVWNARHTLDPTTSTPSAGLDSYDPMSGSFPGVTDGDEFFVTFSGGRVENYSQNFNPGTVQAAATKGVERLLPKDWKLVVRTKKLGVCAVQEFESRSLSKDDRSATTRRGVIVVSYTSNYALAPPVKYNGRNVENAFVQGGIVLLSKRQLNKEVCGV